MSGTTVVVFNYTTWAGYYSEFLGTVTPAQAQNNFNAACFYLDNTGGSAVVDAAPGGRRETILYMITAHIAQLLQGSAVQPVSPLVGQVVSAGEGTVNVAVNAIKSESAEWWAQTKYGLMAWTALSVYRGALYMSAPQMLLANRSLAGIGFGGALLGR